MARQASRTVAEWDPFREFSLLQDRMDRLFRNVFDRGFGFLTQELAEGEFMPSTDFYEDENSVHLNVEVPGVDEKNLSISIENNVLTVKGERKLEKDEKRENFLRQERPYGKFSRSFTLPGSVDLDHVNANYVNGVLQIELAKRAEARPKQIKVNIGQKALPGEAKAA
jgi:HSP20 family protein